MTGACGGIGKEFCRLLVSKGENLILLGRNEDKLESLKAELLLINPSVSILTKEADLSSEKYRLEVFSYLTDSNITFSGLYLVAGIDTRKAFVSYTEEKLRRQIRVNFESAVSLTLFCLNRRANEFRILVVSSACGLTAMPYFSLYSATKSALINFYKGLKAELRGSGVKITVVCPGSVPTREDIIEDIKAQGLQGKLSKKSPSFVAKKSLNALRKNKTVYVPGVYNKLVAIISKITPYSISSRVIAKKFKNKEKDAF